MTGASSGGYFGERKNQAVPTQQYLGHQGRGWLMETGASEKAEMLPAMPRKGHQLLAMSSIGQTYIEARGKRELWKCSSTRKSKTAERQRKDLRAKSTNGKSQAC